VTEDDTFLVGCAPDLPEDVSIAAVEPRHKMLEAKFIN
jgi:hypothetical protein